MELTNERAHVILINNDVDTIVKHHQLPPKPEDKYTSKQMTVHIAYVSYITKKEQNKQLHSPLPIF